MRFLILASRPDRSTAVYEISTTTTECMTCRTRSWWWTLLWGVHEAVNQNVKMKATVRPRRTLGGVAARVCQDLPAVIALNVSPACIKAEFRSMWIIFEQYVGCQKGKQFVTPYFFLFRIVPLRILLYIYVFISFLTGSPSLWYVPNSFSEYNTSNSQQRSVIQDNPDEPSLPIRQRRHVFSRIFKYFFTFHTNLVFRIRVSTNVTNAIFFRSSSSTERSFCDLGVRYITLVPDYNKVWFEIKSGLK
jgi:hypothetical protein